MLFHLRQPSLSIINSDTSFSSDKSYRSDIRPASSSILHQLVVNDLDDITSASFNHRHPRQRELFRIPRPILTMPRSIIDVPINNSLRTSNARLSRVQENSRSPSPSLITQHSERPLYQNLPSQVPPPPIPLIPTQYQTGPPPPFQRFVPIPTVRPLKQKTIFREKPPGLFTTLSAGGFYTLAGLIYLSFLLALPIVKFVLGILYINECPVNKNIPLYLIISGACGLALVILLLLSSACTCCRTMSNAKKSTHRFIICTIAFARGMQGAIAIFLFIWFFFGNIWVFNARYFVRTDRPNDINNYCHPTLYWFAYYVLIFTYIYAIFTCCIKFCVNFFCCGVCDIWYKAFS